MSDITTPEQAAEYYASDFVNAFKIKDISAKSFYEYLRTEYQSLIDELEKNEPYELLGQHSRSDVGKILAALYTPDETLVTSLIEQVFRKAKHATYNQAYAAAEAKYIKQLDDLKKELQTVKDNIQK